ncbi:MAG: DUF6798 domain-containing protein [Phormidesmis sp.]
MPPKHLDRHSDQSALFQSVRGLLWSGSFVLFSSVAAYGYNFVRSNIFNQMPAIAALADRSLFTQDFYIQEMLGFTARSYYYHLILMFHQMGVSLPVVAFGLFLLAFGSMVGGLWAIGAHLGKSPVAGMMLAFLGLATIDGTVGSTGIFRTEPVAAVYAMGLAIWGIYFCCARRWRLGYLMFGLAGLLQFLVGFLPACLWGVGLLAGTVFRGRIGQFVSASVIFCLLVGIVYVPMVMAGNTSSDALSNAEFVKLYAYVRHPHHIVMSSFSVDDWRDFFGYAGAGLVSLRLSDRLSFAQKRDLTATVVVAGVLLLMGYVFVEHVPVALIAKLQLARVTPFVMLTVWMAVSVLACEYHERQNYPVSLLLLALPLVHGYGVIALLLLTLALWLAKRMGKAYDGQPAYLKPFVQLNTLKMTARRSVIVAYVAFFIVLLICWPHSPILFLSLAYPLTQQYFPVFYRRSRPYFKLATVGIVFYLGLHLAGVVDNVGLTPLHKKITVYAPPRDALEQLATDFGQVSPVDALVMVPPTDSVFRFHSNRSVVVTFKSFPFTDQGILTWEARLEDILGPLNAQTRASSMQKTYGLLSSKELVDIAQRYGAGYVLTQQKWHPDIAGRMVLQRDDWVVWQLP